MQSSTRNLRAGARSSSHPDPSRLYRAHIEPRDSRLPERTVFVRAGGRRAAITKIAAALAPLEHCSAAEVEDRIYNCHSAQECIDQGCSDDSELRLFETGWSGDRVVAWVEQPLFLVDDPAHLIRAWSRTQASQDGAR